MTDGCKGMSAAMEKYEPLADIIRLRCIKNLEFNLNDNLQSKLDTPEAMIEHEQNKSATEKHHIKSSLHNGNMSLNLTLRMSFSHVNRHCMRRFLLQCLIRTFLTVNEAWMKRVKVGLCGVDDNKSNVAVFG